MSFNFEYARNLMVENQLRPNKISNTVILELFNYIKKENFLSENLQKISYSDADINIDNNRGYIKNLHIAQLIQSADIKKEDTVMHIGGLTGYVSAILSNLCKELIVIEFNDLLMSNFKKNITNLNLDNVHVFKNKFEDGYIDKSPYDIIFIDNPVYEVTNQIKNQLKNNSGKLIMIKKIDEILCKAQKLTKVNDTYNTEYLFDVFSKYELYKKKDSFVF